jgi:C1A family cysteine protease
VAFRELNKTTLNNFKLMTVVFCKTTLTVSILFGEGEVLNFFSNEELSAEMQISINGEPHRQSKLTFSMICNEAELYRKRQETSNKFLVSDPKFLFTVDESGENHSLTVTHDLIAKNLVSETFKKGIHGMCFYGVNKKLFTFSFLSEESKDTSSIVLHNNAFTNLKKRFEFKNRVRVA